MRFTFDPDHVALLEAEGWRAYYAKKWPRVLYLMERTAATEFHVPVPLSLRAAYLVTRAAVAFKPMENDLATTWRALRAYYQIVGRWSRLGFVTDRVADLELQYWIVHRRLSGAEDHTELEDVFAELHAATFGIPRERARESAKWRTRATMTVDEITSGRVPALEGYWLRAKEQLRRCYRSLQKEIEA